jgi:class 3 adenylate cyclase/tetratricopeptide (TPR) repeat protein
VDPAEILRPYVSRLLISWLRETPDARHKQVEGSLAFVDISGFTQLTERLARKGKVGSEEVSDTLDSVFGQLLSVAYDYGAGVVKWGGDAVLLLFRDDDHAARACRASFGMHGLLRQIGSLQTSAGRVRLRMSTGIHSGSFDFFLAGGAHLELVLTGPGATETIAMEAAADAGETVVSRATAAMLEPALRGPSKAGGIVLARPPDVHPQRAGTAPDSSGLALERFFSPAIREHLLAEVTDPEHRMVTASFLELRGAEELLVRQGGTALADALDECLQNVQEAAERHEVTIFDNDPTPGGAKLMLVAGAPRSSGGDEERMLRTLRRAFDRPGTLPLRAGVNTGRVFADEFGPYYRRTYTVKGDAVNLAARLMSKADTGEILASPAVLARSRTAFEVEPVEPFHVKGKAHPVEAAVVGALIRSGRADVRDAPLVGREAELGILRDGLESARRGEGRLVELVGEPGIGKSRLVEDVCASASGLTVLRASGEEYEASTAYFALRGMLRDLLGIAEGESPSVAARQLRERVESMAPQLLPWLPLLAIPLELEVPSTPETDRLDEKFRKTQLEQVASEFLGEMLGAPTLLVAEDTHWMDEVSLDLLRALVRDVPGRPWLILATRRPEDGPLAADGVEIALEPLSADAVETLLHSATDSSPLPAHRLRALAERSGGNPLFLIELIADVSVSRGEALPDSVEALVTAQIDRLVPADRVLLRQAAVLGRSFDEGLLASTLEGQAGPPDDEAWARLSRFLVREAKGHVHFRHALIRDAAYEGLPYRRRRELHERVGETIERLAGSDPESEASHLSLHFFHAQRFEAAWRYSKLAGEHAQRIYANAEAADFYARALDAARHVRDVAATEIADVHEALGDAMERLGVFDQSAAAYRDARRRRAGDAVAEAALMLKEGWARERQGRYPQALAWFRRGLRLLGGDGGPERGATRARLMVGYATVRQMQGRSSEAVRWCRGAIAEAEHSGERSALAHAYYIQAWAYMDLGRSADAVSLPLALTIYEELGDLEKQALVRELMGVFAYYEGRWDEAVELYERARDAYGTIGDPVRRAADVFNIAEIRCDQGRLEEAEELLDEPLRVFKAAGLPARVALVTRQLGTVGLRAGRLDDAFSLFERAREGFLEVGAQNETVDTDGRIAECLLLQDDDRGLEIATGALNRARSIGPESVHVPMLERVTGYALLRAGDVTGACKAFEESLRAARERRAQYQVALTLDALVRLDRLRGSNTEAVATERDSILAELAVVELPPAPTRIEALVPLRASGR